MSIIILYSLPKDDVSYLCCKLENTGQTHGSVRSPELLGRNYIVIIAAGLYIYKQAHEFQGIIEALSYHWHHSIIPPELPFVQNIRPCYE